MSVAIQMTKEEVLARLREQLPIAEAYDKESAKKHKEDEKAWHARFKASMLKLSKADYVTAKNFTRYGDIRVPVGQAPECPLAKAVQIKRAIQRVEMSNLKAYRMSGDHGSMHGDIYALVTWEPDPPRADVC